MKKTRYKLNLKLAGLPILFSVLAAGGFSYHAHSYDPDGLSMSDFLDAFHSAANAHVRTATRLKERCEEYESNINTQLEEHDAEGRIITEYNAPNRVTNGYCKVSISYPGKTSSEYIAYFTDNNYFEEGRSRYDDDEKVSANSFNETVIRRFSFEDKEKIAKFSDFSF